jgi:hypothetical protein
MGWGVIMLGRARVVSPSQGKMEERGVVAALQSWLWSTEVWFMSSPLEKLGSLSFHEGGSIWGQHGRYMENGC